MCVNGKIPQVVCFRRVRRWLLSVPELISPSLLPTSPGEKSPVVPRLVAGCRWLFCAFEVHDCLYLSLFNIDVVSLLSLSVCCSPLHGFRLEPWSTGQSSSSLLKSPWIVVYRIFRHALIWCTWWNLWHCIWSILSLLLNSVQYCGDAGYQLAQSWLLLHVPIVETTCPPLYPHWNGWPLIRWCLPTRQLDIRIDG